MPAATNTVAVSYQGLWPLAQGAEEALNGGGGAPGADGGQTAIGRGRRGLERVGTAAGALQCFRSLVRPFDAATLRSEGRRTLLRFTRSSDDRWSHVPLAGATRRPEDCAGEDDRTGEQQWSRRAGILLLRGGEAAGEEKGAKGVKNYLIPRLRCPPDVSCSGAGRRRSSSRCGGRRALAEVGAISGRSSGASQTNGRELRSSG